MIKHQQKGFTLVELLIAMSILSMVLATATYSYSLLSSRWDKSLGQFNLKAEQSKALDLLNNTLNSVDTFVVMSSEQKPGFFFVGDNDSILAVANRGVFSSGKEIFRLTFVKNEQDRFDLIYQSSSLSQNPLTSSSQTFEFDNTIILFSDLVDIDIQYLGWRHLYDKTEKNNDHYRWTNSYSGISSQYLPHKIKMTFAQDKNKVSFVATLPTDVERWISAYVDKD